jgi:hypothetical protein
VTQSGRSLDADGAKYRENTIRCLTGIAVALIMASACTVQSDNPPYDPSEIEAAARQFQDLAHTFNYGGLREVTTPKFEFLIFGRRMTLDEFETMLRAMEAERE